MMTTCCHYESEKKIGIQSTLMVATTVATISAYVGTVIKFPSTWLFGRELILFCGILYSRM